MRGVYASGHSKNWKFQRGNHPGLVSCRSWLRDQVEITLKDNALIITPIEKELRAGWFENYKSDEDIDVWADYVSQPGEEDEWEW